MAKTLGGEAEHEAEKLADAEPEAAAKRERNAAVQVAGDLAELFSELQTFPGDEHHGVLVEKHVGGVKEQAGIPWEAVVEVGPEQIVVCA